MNTKRSSMNLVRHGLVVQSVLLSLLLVLATALAVAAIIYLVVNRQVEQAADRRLADGAAFFRASLEDTLADLAAAGAWLGHDQEFLSSVQGNRSAAVEERLALAAGLLAVDEALVANPSGEMVARVRSDDRAVSSEGFGEATGFRAALAGRNVAGIDRGVRPLLRLVQYLPVNSPAGAPPIGVLRLSSFLDEKDLGRFRSRTGLDISAFFGEERLITTLRQPDGTPLTGVGADPAIFREVVENGREVVAWRNLPIGRVRSFYAPLVGPDGTRVGMFSITVPVEALAGELRSALLPLVPVIAAIILAGSTLAYLLPRRVHGPVLLLAEAAARLGSGDLTKPIPPVQQFELAPLAEQLEEARSMVRQRLDFMADLQAYQRVLFSTLREPVLTTGADGRIRDFNAAAVALFGAVEDLSGYPIARLLPFTQSAPSASAQVPVWQGAVEDATGRTLDVEVSRTALSRGGAPITHIYVVHDISYHAELNRLREQLLYNVAHELRGPMAVLENSLEIIAAEFGELTASELDRLMRSARRNVARLHSLMENLLSAGSIRSGRFLIQPKPTWLSVIVHDAMQAVEEQAAARGQQLRRWLGDHDFCVLADDQYIRQVLSNLLTNASKYTPDGGSIQVDAAEIDGTIRVTVEDTGLGIPKDQLAGLFERFYRTRASHEEPGIGLGLAIVKGIVEAHGGTVGIESEVGQGTKVWFTLPRAEGRA